MYFKTKSLLCRLFIISLLIFCAKIGFGQINSADSSVQVYTLWNLNESNTYEVTFQQLTYRKEDTLSNLTLSYDIDITVMDSSENSYTVRWQNKNFSVVPSNRKLKTLYDAAFNKAIDIKISRSGVFKEVINWKEVKKSTKKSFSKIRREVISDDQANRSFYLLNEAIQSKRNMESNWIPDVHQYYMFHGASYSFNKDIKGKIQTPNLHYKSNPHDAYITIVLEEISSEFNKYTIRAFLEVDTEQLTNATYDFVSRLMEGAGKSNVERSEYPDVSKVIETAAIFHSSGWVIDSTQWKSSVTGETTMMEIRRIKFK
ncbi:MAG: hypothetical protein IPI60_12750 [Saprospiraceae bacterium]|nr:hypothetical protein [Saprospiraceae bacterium]